ncbi:hypothetical protein [Zobellia alginiliquefaciens]|uniref:hypothetical protein n=1 Tax=Zobellia alginiliquefaciens TaxID=3032586 RepID=UPI0023E3EBB6|nr:hypothetical protein [Zobellia alginiliquefaciens]
MEFSFESYEFIKSINENANNIRLLAYIGVPLIYIPYRLVLKLLKQDMNGKINLLGLFYFIIIWIMSGVTLGILCQDETSGLKLFLVLVSIISVNLVFVLTNHFRLYKLYQSTLKEIIDQQ